jgi:hypothetical protein
MTFLKTSRDGELFVDHSASPGIPAERARQMGLPPEMVGEGSRMYAATLGCPHCGCAVVLNPMRKRERANCFKCNAYICDGCAYLMSQPDYVHRTFAEIADMVRSGKWIVSGTMSNLTLTPTEK